MVFKVHLVLKERKEELEMLVSQDSKDKRETQDLLVKWVHLESKVLQVYPDSLDNRVFQVYLVIRDHLEGKEIQVHQVLMVKMVLMESLVCQDLLETEASLEKMEA